jgi:hypothetical protein
MTNAPDDPEGKLIRPSFGVMDGGGNRIEPMASGGFMVFWRGKPVYANGRIKKFQAEDVARVFLARCDASGKIIH